MRRNPVLSLTALAPLLGALAFGVEARADSPFDGKWRQSALREDFTVQKWQTGCGPPPRSSSTGGGETVTVRAEGDVLSFVGGGRVYRSNQCYDQLPTLARETYSHAADSRLWRVRCTTPPGDPRKTIMQTLVAATSDTHIDITETGRYEIAHEDGLCVADVKRTRSFDLVQKDGPAAPATATATAPAPAPTPPPPPKEEPKPTSSCAAPGPPARLEARPSKKLLRPGETFVFRGKTVDREGCPLPSEVTWAASKEALAAKISVDSKGKVTVPEGTPEGEYTLEATSDGKTAKVVLSVTSAANYEALLTKDGLNAAGETDTASVTSFPGVSIGSSEVAADDGHARRRAVFVGVVGTAVVALAIAYVVLRRRQRRAQALEAEAVDRYESRVRETEARNEASSLDYEKKKRAHEESLRAAEEAKEKLAAARAARAAATRARASGAAIAAPVEERTCPTCKRTFENTYFCPHDGSKLVEGAQRDELSGALSCPTCKKGFPEGTKVCPEHGDELVPTGAPRPAPVKAARGKICPSCGARFDGAATFCGKDGTSLVLLN